MKKRIALVLVLLISFASIVQASTTEELSDYQKQLEENQTRQQELERKIEALQTQERSLQNQIDYMDSQIALTNLKVDEAQTKIAERQIELEGLSLDIEELIARIGRIEESVQYQGEVYGQRVRERYKVSRLSAFEILFGADSLSDVFTRLKYLKMMERQDQRLITQMGDTQLNYKNQKKLLEETKQQVEQVKKDLEQEKINLEARRADLDRQKREKEHILAITSQEEANYQRLLQQVRAELEALLSALSGGAKIGPVKKGEIIALEGNTGCVCSYAVGCNPPTAQYPTAGSHLHFGVYKNGVAVNPRPYMESGELDWPEKNTIVTQEFGENYNFYMRNFGVPGHNGIDMTSGYGSPIFAAADGVAYKTGDDGQYLSWCNGPANGVRVEHENGLVTLYWHLK